MEEDPVTTIQTGIRLSLEPGDAFSTIMEELDLALKEAGMDVEFGEKGWVKEGGFVVGKILSWNSGKRIIIRWHPADWTPAENMEVELEFEPIEAGTQVNVTLKDWGKQVGDPGEMAGWFAHEVITPLLRAISPGAFGNWLTDRLARRPSGGQSRSIYKHPVYHFPNFRVILKELSLTNDDYLLEVGCGGGAFLKEALKNGCSAAAVDHSLDMVRLAQEVNGDAVNEGRLEVRHAGAEKLPFPESTFSCAVMTGVFGFLQDPVSALKEIHRVLSKNGRLIIMGSDPKWRGTPAAPEPMASRLRFYTDDEFEKLAIEAEFKEVHVVRRSLEPYARESGVPEEHLELFKGTAPFLIAKKG